VPIGLVKMLLFPGAIHGFAGNPRGQLHWARAGPYHGGRACPLRQLQKTHGGVGALPYLPREQHAKLRPRQV
jgi:hypothetical protein